MKAAGSSARDTVLIRTHHSTVRRLLTPHLSWMRWQYERISYYLTEEERGVALAPAISGYSSLISTPFAVH